MQQRLYFYTFCDCSDYKCDSNDYFNGKNRFECSPSDLSGKYGSIPYNGNNSINSTFWDDLSISVGELDGKSLVLQCENTYYIVVLMILPLLLNLPIQG